VLAEEERYSRIMPASLSFLAPTLPLRLPAFFFNDTLLVTCPIAAGRGAPNENAVRGFSRILILAFTFPFGGSEAGAALGITVAWRRSAIDTDEVPRAGAVELDAEILAAVLGPNTLASEMDDGNLSVALVEELDGTIDDGAGLIILGTVALGFGACMAVNARSVCTSAGGSGGLADSCSRC
jgi:hypothetical protein